MRRHRPMACLPYKVAPQYYAPKGMGPTGVSPMALAPKAVSPSMVSPMGIAPTMMGPMGLGPMGVPPAAPGPTRVAPVQRVVHPTQNIVRQRTTRYPIENIYPVHTHNVHNHIREHYHRTVCSESHQDCCYDVQCGPIPRRR